MGYLILKFDYFLNIDSDDNYISTVQLQLFFYLLFDYNTHMFAQLNGIKYFYLIR